MNLDRHTFNGVNFPILTNTSKMPGFSFSLPAHSFEFNGSCIGAVYGKNENGMKSVCDSCYAGRGFYSYPNVKNSQQARFAWTKEAVLDGTFVEVMTRAIRNTSTNYFRVFDSGDFYSIKLVRAFREICAALPEVKFWIPTRTWQFLPFLIELQKLNSLPNVSVRPSALYQGEDLPEIPYLSVGTSVDRTYYTCPASSQNNQCLSCRKCWDKTSVVTYKAH